MRGGHVRAIAAIVLIAGPIAACGGGDKPAAPAAKGKVLRGETETGMKLKVETFVSPASDPRLKELDAYRSANGYAKVDYHRITADNTKGQVPDRERTVTFAKTVDAIGQGQGIVTRFACDSLRYEWQPKTNQQTAHDKLANELCKVSPEKPDAVKPGAEQVYYVVSDRTFAERGIERLKVFGPSSAELR
jgi:hypothetical protein